MAPPSPRPPLFPPSFLVMVFHSILYGLVVICCSMCRTGARFVVQGHRIHLT